MEKEYAFVDEFAKKIKEENIEGKERQDLFLKMAEEAGIEEDERVSAWTLFSLALYGLNLEVAGIIQAEFEEDHKALRTFLTSGGDVLIAATKMDYTDQLALVLYLFNKEGIKSKYLDEDYWRKSKKLRIFRRLQMRMSFLGTAIDFYRNVAGLEGENINIMGSDGKTFHLPLSVFF